MPTIQPGIQRLGNRESSQSSTTEVVIPNISRTAKVLRIHAYLVSGTGTTVQPILGRKTDPGAVGNEINQILLTSAAAHVDEVPAQPIPFTTDSTQNLYLRLQPDHTDANHVIDWELILEPGA